MKGETKKIVYLVNHLAFFESHRLELALEAERRGYEVHLLVGRGASSQMERSAIIKVEAAGITYTRLSFSSTSVNPFQEILGFLQILRCLRNYDADILHCISPKGIIYGGISARILKIPSVIFAVSGFGLTNSVGKMTLRRKVISLISRTLQKVAFQVSKKRVILQNSADVESAIKFGYCTPHEVIKTHGSGVDLGLFSTYSQRKKKKNVLFAARMLRSKGVVDFISAAEICRKNHPDWTFIMAGSADYDSPDCVLKEDLLEAESKGIIKWVGHVHDMTPLFLEASVFCFPSYYGEGMPKVLLEAAAAGCAIVTSDIAACREAIKPGVTGETVPIKDPEALAQRLSCLLNDPDRRISYGREGRVLAYEKYDVQKVIELTLDGYLEVFNN